jgi:hypothetical protein
MEVDTNKAMAILDMVITITLDLIKDSIKDFNLVIIKDLIQVLIMEEVV